MNTRNECGDFNFELIPFFAELIAAEGLPDAVRSLRYEALRTLQEQLVYYQRLGYDARLLCGIAKKKAALILKASTKAEMKRLSKPRGPRFNGAEFVPDESSIPEEELICWSETSLRVPLNEYGCKRYLELFRLVFPNESKALSI